MAGTKPEGLFQKEIEGARREWQGALDKLPRTQIPGPDYSKVLKTMESDPRVAERVMIARRGQLLADGLDFATADQQAKADLLRFRNTFGR